MESSPLTAMFSLMCRKKTPTNWVIPDSVVWENGLVRGWYYYDRRTQTVQRRKYDTLAVLETFLQDVAVLQPQRDATGHISLHTWAASIEHTAAESAADSIVASLFSIVDRSQAVIVSYLNPAALIRFLTAERRIDVNCVLQVWVAPRDGLHVDAVMLDWTPKVVQVSRVRNVHGLKQTRATAHIPLRERAVTFDGQSHLSKEIYCTPSLVEAVRAYGDTLAAHYRAVTPGSMITRMVLYLKIEPPPSDTAVVPRRRVRNMDPASANLSARDLQRDAADGSSLPQASQASPPSPSTVVVSPQKRRPAVRTENRGRNVAKRHSMRNRKASSGGQEGAGAVMLMYTSFVAVSPTVTIPHEGNASSGGGGGGNSGRNVEKLPPLGGSGANNL